MDQRACHQHWEYALWKSKKKCLSWDCIWVLFPVTKVLTFANLASREMTMLLTKSWYDLQGDLVIVRRGGSELTPTLPCLSHKEGPKHLPRKERFFFNWWKIALQPCVGFCHAATWISHNYTYISSLLSFLSFPPSHLSRLSQNTRLDSMCYAATFHPPSISHMIVYECHCYFLNLSHPHSPPLCPQLSSLLGSLVPFIYIPCICIDIWYLFSFWLMSLCIRF